MDEVVRSLESLFPPFGERVVQAIPKMADLDLYVFETYRDLKRQMDRYSQGRELHNGLWVVVDPKAVVTNAKPGMSFHGYGLAFDGVPDGDLAKQGIQWSWKDTYTNIDGTTQKVAWKAYGTLVKGLGMTWAGDWLTFPEYPHAECRYGCTASELYQILTSEGLESVWKYLYRKINIIPKAIPVPIALEPKPDPIPVVAAADLDVHAAQTKPGVLALLLQLIKAVFKR